MNTIRPKHMPQGKVKVKTDVSDERLCCCEVYNFNKHTIIFDLDITMISYVQSQGISVGHYRIEVPPDQFAFLTHRYYFTRFKDSLEPAFFLMNTGKNMGKGIKNQSAPEVFTRSF